MDLVTQGLLGACTASVAGRRLNPRAALAIGFIAGLAADLDILIASEADPLLNLEFHRHFTHSLLFVPIAALILASVIWPLMRHRLRFREVYLLTFFGYLPSGFLDACTSYGTLFFWPLSDERISFNIISIVDPLFSGILIIGAITVLWKQTRLPAQLALILAVAYLGFGLLQKHNIEQRAHQLATQRGHTPERLLVKPTLGNLFLWRSVYRYQDVYHVDALRYNPLSGREDLFAGSSATAFDASDNPLQLPSGSRLLTDIDRFAYFSGEYLALDTDRNDLIVDLRYANLPHQIEPLWGIRIDPDDPSQHARFEHFRDRSQQARQAFLAMLFPD
jgi:inner membrane protein